MYGVRVDGLPKSEKIGRKKIQAGKRRDASGGPAATNVSTNSY